jgi:hypothetical protein
MATRSTHSKRPVTVIELPQFEAAAQRLLDAHTLRALYLLLAENPLAGSAVSGYTGLLELNFAKLRILYSVGGRFSKVYLLDILEGHDPFPPPTTADGKLIKKALDVVVKGGVVLAVREAVRELWIVIKDHLL